MTDDATPGMTPRDVIARALHDAQDCCDGPPHDEDNRQAGVALAGLATAGWTITREPGEIRHHCELPEGAMVVGVYEIVSYLTEDGEREFAARRAGDDPYASTVGMLVWAQKRLLDEWDREVS